MKINYSPTLFQFKKWRISFFLFPLIFILPISQFAQQTYTFTNCGATGSVGPTQTQVNNAYTLTNLAGMVGTTTTGIQTWTVPATGLYRVTARGASSGVNGNTARLPGYGATMAGDFSLNAGDVLQILVGQMGENHPSYAAGGGGGSFVTKSPHNSTLSILVIAGGGGAPSGDFNGLSAVTATCGTFDVQSGPGQCGGAGGITFTGNSGGAGGGFFTDGAGNTTVANGGKAYVNGGAGALTTMLYARGGFGGGGGNASPATSTYASNGGGGFSGGNGGNRNSTSGTGRMGGGGGGSFNNGINQANSVNTSTGHGLVTIQELCNITLNNNLTGNNNAVICSGTTLTLTTNAVSNYSWSNGSNAASIAVTPSITTVYSLAATSSLNCVASRQMTVTVSAGIPTLSIVSSTNSICLGRTVTLTASGAVTYTWSNGMTNGGAFTPSTTSVYTVTGQNGCGTATAATAVSIAPLAVSVISNPTVVCAGSTSTLTAAAAANSYSWFPVLSTAGSSLIVSPLVNTIYTVAASDGTCFGTATVAVSANPVPTIVASPSLAFICSGDQIALSASGGLSYTWTPGNLSGASVTVSPTAPTPYQVIGTNTFGCFGVDNLAIVVNPSPTLNLVASTNFICAGDPVNITVSGANSYTWAGGANTTSISVNPSVTTNYAVSGELNGCTSSTNISIAVFIPTLSITGNTSICMGQSSTITASGGNTYSWSNGFTSASILVSPSSNTLYSVSALTNSGSINCPSSGSIQVQVKALPTVLANASNSNICRGESAVLTASGANSYTWSNGANTASISPSSSLVSTFVFTVTGTNSLSCNNSATVQLKVNACVGIEENLISNAALSVFPNPNNGSFNITAQAEIEINITNELGQLIKSSKLNENNNYKLTVENLSPGIYFVIGQNENQKNVQKIIVTK